MKPIESGKKVFLRSIGKDEKWLQSELEKNPSLLPFSDLKPTQRERKQSTGGRLDLLFTSTEDLSMYEVEVMLGETDPSHIIRCIEYWDIERRRFPQRQHFAVLIAESFSRRYFNVVQLLSLNIPIIAVQLDVIEAEKAYILNFTKVMDIYEEPDTEVDTIEVKEEDWEKDSPWVNKGAKTVISELKLIDPDGSLALKYTQQYIAIARGGSNQFYFNKRTKPRFKVGIRISNQELATEVKKAIEPLPVSFERKGKEFIASNVEITDQLISTIKVIYQTKINYLKTDKSLENDEV